MENHGFVCDNIFNDIISCSIFFFIGIILGGIPTWCRFDFLQHKEGENWGNNNKNNNWLIKQEDELVILRNKLERYTELLENTYELKIKSDKLRK